MKSILTLLIAIVVITSGSAQITNPASNNVTVGTSTVLDNAEITIKPNVAAEWKHLALDGVTDDWFLGSFSTGGFFISKDNFSTANSKFTILGDNVGIGTYSPSYRLTVKTNDENHLRFENGSELAFIKLGTNGNLSFWAHGDNDLVFNRGVGSGLESMRINSFGNLGLGTANPSYKLTVKTEDENHLRLENGAELGFLKLNADGNLNFWVHGDDDLVFTRGGGSGLESMRITSLGNLGLGTANPSYKLTVKTEDENHLRLENGTELGFLKLNGDGNLNFWVHGDDDMIFTRGAGSGAESMRIAANGNVGIGTSPTNIDSKLTVGGNIHAREIKVTVDAGADFVFQDEYSLLPLDEVEKFVRKNKHLPEIAPAKTMEENGLELGQMNIKLLQKIEELTLYMIEFQKEMEELRDNNSALKEEIRLLKKQLAVAPRED